MKKTTSKEINNVISGLTRMAKSGIDAKTASRNISNAIQRAKYTAKCIKNA